MAYNFYFHFIKINRSKRKRYLRTITIWLFLLPNLRFYSLTVRDMKPYSSSNWSPVITQLLKLSDPFWIVCTYSTIFLHHAHVHLGVYLQIMYTISMHLLIHIYSIYAFIHMDLQIYTYLTTYLKLPYKGPQRGKNTIHLKLNKYIFKFEEFSIIEFL